MNKRPLTVTIVAWVYIVVGAIGFGYHLKDFQGAGVIPYQAIGIELVRLAAIIAGIFMLRGRNWARWVAVAWMGLHAVVGVLHGFAQAATHGLFLVVILWLLFRPEASPFFKSS
jgi:hypothetical protein